MSRYNRGLTEPSVRICNPIKWAGSALKYMRGTIYQGSLDKSLAGSWMRWYNLAKIGHHFMTTKWLTIAQIADHLQVSREKVYKLCQRGKMPTSKFGGQWRFDVKEVDRWMKQQRPKRKKS